MEDLPKAESIESTCKHVSVSKASKFLSKFLNKQQESISVSQTNEIVQQSRESLEPSDPDADMNINGGTSNGASLAKEEILTRLESILTAMNEENDEDISLTKKTADFTPNKVVSQNFEVDSAETDRQRKKRLKKEKKSAKKAEKLKKKALKAEKKEKKKRKRSTDAKSNSVDASGKKAKKVKIKIEK